MLKIGKSAANGRLVAAIFTAKIHAATTDAGSHCGAQLPITANM